MAEMEECPRCHRVFQVGPQCPCWMDDSDTQGVSEGAHEGDSGCPGNTSESESDDWAAQVPARAPAQAGGGVPSDERPPLLRQWADDPFVASRNARTRCGRRAVHDIIAAGTSALLRANQELIALAEEEAQLEQKRKRLDTAEGTLKQRKRLATGQLRSALKHSAEIVALAEATF